MEITPAIQNIAVYSLDNNKYLFIISTDSSSQKSIDLGTLKLKGIRGGESSVKIKTEEVLATGPESLAVGSTQTVKFTITASPTPTPVPCAVTTQPREHNLVVGGAKTVTASVTSGLGSKTITKMRFGTYNTGIATVNPTSDSTTTSIYSTTVTAVAVGSTAVWATADLSDGRTCESKGDADTDIVVNALTPTPTPTLKPTLTPTKTPTPTATPRPTNTPIPTPTPTKAPTPTPIPDSSILYNQCVLICDYEPFCVQNCNTTYNKSAGAISAVSPTPTPTPIRTETPTPTPIPTESSASNQTPSKNCAFDTSVGSLTIQYFNQQRSKWLALKGRCEGMNGAYWDWFAKWKESWQSR